MILPSNHALEKMNEFGSAGIPFLFIIDFEINTPEIIPLNEVNPDKILYNFEGVTNSSAIAAFKGKFEWQIHPVEFSKYVKAFNNVINNLRFGNSYLVNLTFPTKIETNLSLKEIYNYSRAKFKLLYHDKFVVFSPEPFVKISNGKIFSYPMKGTIDASIPNAEQIILQNTKETAEHNTIVDLIRNDLSMVSENVRVDSFRYIDKIITNSGQLLQVSSCISGDLTSDYKNKIGEIIFSMLPAGSVTGAPKKKTLAIIKSAENYDRGYYTGVMGIFNGSELISSVMIRFIEKNDTELFYKSGGGITIHSNQEEEYQELIKKIYVPFI